jgi:alkylhydroperoxidase family enzyme
VSVSGDGPRIPPLPREQWDDEVRAALAVGLGEQAAATFMSDAPDAPPMPNVLGTLLHHPRLAGRLLRYNGVLLQHGTIDARLRELMILRVAWKTRAPYEWAQHVQLALRNDVTRDEIDAIATGAAGDAWSEVERALLRATDELLDHYRVDDGTWAELAEHFDDRQLLEVLFVVGTYACLAMVFNSAGIGLDPGLPAEPFPDAR